MTFEKKLASDGTPIYYKDGKRIKRLQVPKQQLAEFDLPVEIVDEPVVDSANVNSEAPITRCVFCQQEGTKQRFVNLQTVYLCDDHYFSATLGKIVQQLREGSIV